MKVSKLLKLHGMLVLTVHPDFTLAEAARRFAQSVGSRRFSLAVVTNHEDQVLGVISLGDISHALGQHEEKAAKMLVKDVMTTNVISCSLDDDLEDVLKTMADKGIRHTPVVEAGKLAGLVARRDALEFLYQQASLDAAHLTDWLFRSDARYQPAVLRCRLATTLYDGAFTAESTYRVIEKQRITNLAGAPTAFRLLIAAGVQPAAPTRGRLRVVSSAGETLNPEVIRWFREHLDCPIHDHYGQTEVGMVLCNHHGLSHDNHPGSAGLPVPGFRLAVVDEEGADVSPGAPGILAVDCKSSPLFWFQGYWQQEPRFIGEPTSELVEELQRVVKTRLAAHAYPREIEFIEQLPKTPSGKLQRFILRQQEIAKAHAGIRR